jgi:hypothetical protein
MGKVRPQIYVPGSELTIAFALSTEHVQVPDTLHKVVRFAPELKRAQLILIPRPKILQAQTLRLPVGDARDVALVETGTVLVILLTFVYLLRTIVRASRRAQGVTVKKAD